MALETGTYISDLVSTNPTASDNISQGDDHIRLLKATIKASFPNITGAMTRTHTDLNNLVTLAGAETLTNKTLTNPFVNTAITVTPKSGTNLVGDNLALIAGNGTGTGGSGFIAFQTAAAGTTGTTANTLTERMRIDNAGNVGIGTTSPNSNLRLDVVGNLGVAFRDSVAVNTNSTSRILGGAYTGNLATMLVMAGTNGANTLNIGGSTTIGEPASLITFLTGSAGATGAGTERMRIDSSGNVGIGTTSPLSLFNVNHSGSNSTAIVVGDTANIANNTGIYLRTNGTANIQWGSTGSLALVSGSNERMRIDSSGYQYTTNIGSTQSTAVTLTASQVLGGVIPSSPAGAITLTLPTGTTLDAAFPNVNNLCRDFAIVNTTGQTITLAANTGITLVGTMTITSTSRLFRLQRTGAATYTCYLLS